VNQLVPIASAKLPALVAVAGDRAGMRFLEFFAANIRNPHTRRAYGRAAEEFPDLVCGRRRAIDRSPRGLVERQIATNSSTTASTPEPLPLISVTGISLHGDVSNPVQRLVAGLSG
jgi:hypothetical protein